MTPNGWFQIAVFAAMVLALTKPLGLYLVHVYDGSLTWLRPVERVLYRAAGVDAEEDQHWTHYLAALLVFSAASMLFTYLALRLQHVLPFNPQRLPGVVERQAFATPCSERTKRESAFRRGVAVVRP